MTRRTDIILTRADGSIDTAYYMARGRRMRSEAAHALFSPEAEARRKRRGIFRLFGTSPV